MFLVYQILEKVIQNLKRLVSDHLFYFIVSYKVILGFFCVQRIKIIDQRYRHFITIEPILYYVFIARDLIFPLFSHGLPEVFIIFKT